MCIRILNSQFLHVPGTPPSQRVQFILGEDISDEKHECHPLFSEMEELVTEGDDLEWKETARWIKFEEDVEEGGNRWSKPHVATLSLHSLFELRSLILNGNVILDMQATSIEQVADLLLDNLVNNNILTSDKTGRVRDVLLKRHRHLYQSQKKHHGLPFIRSFSEMKTHSSSKSKYGFYSLFCRNRYVVFKLKAMDLQPIAPLSYYPFTVPRKLKLFNF